MKNSVLISMLASLSILAASPVVANELNQQMIQNQQLSKRPYQVVPDVSTKQQGEDWEGASMMDSAAKSRSNQQLQQLRLHMIGKQPYMAPAK